MVMEFTTVIGKEVLLEKLRKNRERYVETRKTLIDVFKKESEKYQKAYAEYSKKVVESALAEDDNRPHPPSIPEDQTEIYNLYVEMIDRHCGDTLEVDSTNFGKLFMDNWTFIREHIHAMTRLTAGYPQVASALIAYED